MSLEEIPSQFADFFGITLASAQVILSIVLIFMVLLPVMYLTKGKTLIVYLLVFFLVEVVCVGIGWLDGWIILANLMMGAIAIAIISGRALTGSE